MSALPTSQARPRTVRLLFTMGIVGLVALSSLQSPLDWGRREPGEPEEITRGPGGRHLVAVTFDAGGEMDDVSALLASLAAAKVQATFFISGQWASAHPEWVQAIHARGHEIGNHSWSHRDLTALDDGQVRREILRTETLLHQQTGRSTRPLFRAPYGARDHRLHRLLAELGYRSIYWSLDSLDSVEPVKTPRFLVGRITGQPDAALDGAIILMHVGEPATAAALPLILADLQRRHFRAVTVGELLAPR